MKKIKYLLVLILFVFSTTGCVKMNADMEIKATKEMTYKVTYAVDTTVFGDEELLDEDEKKEIEKNGFEIEKYKDGNYAGYILTKKIKNIDDVSTTKKVDSALLAGIDEDAESKYLFTVKKGFLKNTYTANFTFDSSEYDLNSSDDDDNDYEYEDEEYDYSDDYDLEDDSVSSSMALDDDDDDMDFSNMYSNLDVKYTVTLPYGAKSSNAPSKDGKKLTWNLMDSNFKGIEYEFEVYNLPVVIGLAIVILAAIGGGVFFIIKKKKGKVTQAATTTTVEQTTNTSVATPTQNVTTTNPGAQSVENSTPVVEAQPAVQPVSQPEPVVEAQPAVQPVSQPEPVVEAQPAVQPVNQPAPVVEAQPTAQSVSQPEPPVVNNEPVITPIQPEPPVVNNEPVVSQVVNNEAPNNTDNISQN